jgi:nucleoside-diphosphate-sugar epimerase
VQRGLYFHIRGITPTRTFGYVGNTAYQMLRLAEAPLEQVAGSVHYLGDYQPLQVRVWADMIAQQFGRPLARELPRSVARGAAMVGDLLGRVGLDQLPLNSSRYRNMTADSVYDLSALAQVAPDLPTPWRLAPSSRRGGCAMERRAARSRLDPRLDRSPMHRLRDSSHQ